MTDRKQTGGPESPQGLQKLRTLDNIEAEARAHLEYAAFTGGAVLVLVEHIRDVYEQYKELRADRDHWRSNSEEAVRRLCLQCGA